VAAEAGAAPAAAHSAAAGDGRAGVRLSLALENVADLTAFATSLAEFLGALQRIDASHGPPAGAQNFYRGGALAVYADLSGDTG
jgi:aminoglycoside phosphotransferase (APT) family kinase protein